MVWAHRGIADASNSASCIPETMHFARSPLYGSNALKSDAVPATPAFSSSNDAVVIEPYGGGQTVD